MNDWLDAESRVERAHDLYEEGRWAEAAAELRAAIDINPNNPTWHFNLALTLDAMEEHPRACEEYEAALALDPNDVETLNCLGVDLTRLGRYRQALEKFQRIQKINPDYEPGFCNRIITYTEMGDHESAELMFHLASQLTTTCPLCYYNIGNSFYDRRMYDKAIRCWQETLKLDNDHPQANARIAEACWAKGDRQAARGHYLAELRLDPGDIDVLLDFGELLMELKDYAEAGEKFRRVLEQAPDHPEAHFCLGELAMMQEELAVAEEQFRLVLRIDRAFPGAHARVGQILLRRGQNKQAAKHLLAELKNCGDDPGALQELGQLLIEARHTRQANSVLRRLVRLAPQDPQAQHNLAVSFFMIDKLDDGIRHCRRALKLKPEYPLALYNLALAHLHKGQILRARRYIARALMIAPKDEQIRKLSKELGMGGIWSRIRSQLDRWQRGRKMRD